MPPWVQKVTSRKVSTVQNEDDSWTFKRSYSRGGIHVGHATTTVMHFDRDWPSRTVISWPDGTVYRVIPHKTFGMAVHQKVDDAIYEMADALRGVDTQPKAVV